MNENLLDFIFNRFCDQKTNQILNTNLLLFTNECYSTTKQMDITYNELGQTTKMKGSNSIDF